jgi:hypothetical protein
LFSRQENTGTIRHIPRNKGQMSRRPVEFMRVNFLKILLHDAVARTVSDLDDTRDQSLFISAAPSRRTGTLN